MKLPVSICPLELPPEVIEHILCEIPRTHELLQLACTCSLFRDLIIPRHIEYRALKLSLKSSKELDHVWSHLSRRSDLSSNIRHVHLVGSGEEVTQGGPDYPKTLVDADLDSTPMQDPRKKEDVMISALRSMVNLERLTWRWTIPPPSTKVLELIFNTLSLLPSVKKITLIILTAPTNDSGIQTFAVKFHNNSRITRVRLGGRYWVTPSLASLTGDWLQTLRSLTTLRLNPTLLSQCDKLFFPSLNKFGVSRCHPRSLLAHFLARHTTITVFDWQSLGTITLKPRVLPNIQSLRCRFNFLTSMSMADVREGAVPLARPIKRLVILDAAWAGEEQIPLRESTCFDHSKLQYLSLESIQIGSLRNIASLFPMLKEFQLQNILPSPRLEDLYSNLELFQNLEVLQYPDFWELEDFDFDEEMEVRIRALATRLPKLKQVNYPSEDDEQIMIVRDDPITYKVETKKYTMFEEI